MLILADILHYFINFSQILVIFLYFVVLVWNIFFMFKSMRSHHIFVKS